MVLIEFRPRKGKRAAPDESKGKRKIIFYPVRYPELEEQWTASPVFSGFATYRHLPPNND